MSVEPTSQTDAAPAYAAETADAVTRAGRYTARAIQAAFAVGAVSGAAVGIAAHQLLV